MENRRRALTFVAASWIFVVVWLLHRPIDSVLVRHGHALPLAILSLILAAITLAVSPHDRDYSHSIKDKILGREFWISSIPWWIVAWTGLSVWINRWHAGDVWRASEVSSEIIAASLMDAKSVAIEFVGNRDESIAAWCWIVTSACIWTSARRVFGQSSRQVLMLVLVAGGLSLSIRAIYQHWVEIPGMIEQYQSDPDAMLAAAGFEAPPGSAQRMKFENRLFDGGASASFALANSLAALLVMAMVFAASMIGGMNRGPGLVGTVVIGIGLWITQSRSAAVAVTVCIMAVVLLAAINGASWRPRREWVLSNRRAIIGSFAAGLFSIGAAIWFCLRQSEWFAMAPASLQTRLDYWRATLAMSADHPWFGIGPGNFQAAYPIYRLPHTSENIADPHHFWFETLAAGGWPVALALVVWLALVVTGRTDANRSPAKEFPAKEFPANSSPATKFPANDFIGPPPADRQDSVPQVASDCSVDSSGPFWWAAGLGLASVTIYEFANLQLESVTLVANVLAIAWLGLVTRSKVRNSDNLRTGKTCHCVVLIAIVGIGLHLSFSGGWSVPGIAVPLWLLLAVFRPAGRVVEATPKSRRFVTLAPPVLFVVAAIGVTIFVARPNRLATSQVNEINYRLRTSDRAGAKRLVDRLVQTDPTDPSALLLAAAITSQDRSRRAESSWQTLIERARFYGGTSASLERQFLDQALSAYQSTGNQHWLVSATQAAERLQRLSPHDVSNVSAVAIVYAAAGRMDLARQLAAEADELASLTDNLEQDLSRQAILVPLSSDRLKRFGEQFDIKIPIGGRSVLADAETQFRYFELLLGSDPK